MNNLQIHYPDQAEIDARLAELKKWLEDNAETPAEEMQAFFTKRMDSYESVHLGHWAEEYHDFAGLIPPSAKTLLDLGCGTGLELDEIFKLHPQLQVTGIDLTKAYLDKLKEKHPDKALRLIQADYTTYPFENERYDCAISFMTVHHFLYEKKGGSTAKYINPLPRVAAIWNATIWPPVTSTSSFVSIIIISTGKGSRFPTMCLSTSTSP